jgi:hypothetical protein
VVTWQVVRIVVVTPQSVIKANFVVGAPGYCPQAA